MAVTRTTRLPEELDSALQALATSEKVSVNFIINRALQHLVDWDGNAQRFGLASVSTGLLSRLLDHVSAADLKEMGSWAAKDQVKAFIMYSSKEITFSGVIQWLRLYSRYSGVFKADYTVDKSKGRGILFLNHALGSKGSLFFDAMLRSIFSDLLKIQIETSVANDFCLATFDAPN